MYTTISLATKNPSILGWMKTSSYSVLTYNFNVLYSMAINLGASHFAMIHDDIEPENFWLDILLHEMKEHEADMISAVVPIKDSKGITSTAFESEDFYKPHRISVREVIKDFPKTFTHDKILLNTGLMLVRLDKPWAKKVCFKFQDEIIETEKGLEPRNEPEDWNFSRQLRSHGAKLFATKAVKIIHYGVSGYSNFIEWGTK